MTPNCGVLLVECVGQEMVLASPVLKDTALLLAVIHQDSLMIEKSDGLADRMIQSNGALAQIGSFKDGGHHSQQHALAVDDAAGDDESAGAGEPVDQKVADHPGATPAKFLEVISIAQVQADRAWPDWRR